MNEIVKSISVANMVNQRDAVVSRLVEALRLIDEAKELAEAAHVGCPRLMLDGPRGRVAFGSGDVAQLLGTVDGPAWRHLLSESGLRSLMDAKSRAQWDELTHKGEVPPLTFENVAATFEQLHGARADMFERGVLEVFRRLSWDYKTNQPCKFGKKVILRYFLDGFGFVNHQSANEVDDLARVFHVLDGRPEPDHRRGTFHRVSEAKHQSLDFDETEFFTLKWFKKGTAHLTFKRADLVEQMNRILAKHHPNALPSRA